MDAFNLSEPGMFRLFIQDTGKNYFNFVFSFHHAITDGWSVASLISEFIALYTNDEENCDELIPAYAKFVAKEIRALSKDQYKEFWLEYFSDYEFSNKNLLLDNAASISEGQVIISEQIENTNSEKIIRLSNKMGIPLGTVTK